MRNVIVALMLVAGQGDEVRTRRSLAERCCQCLGETKSQTRRDPKVQALLDTKRAEFEKLRARGEMTRALGDAEGHAGWIEEGREKVARADRGLDALLQWELEHPGGAACLAIGISDCAMRRLEGEQLAPDVSCSNQCFKACRPGD